MGMIPLSNHDFQGSGEQWGRDEINPDTWILWVINHPAFTDPCRLHPQKKIAPSWGLLGSPKGLAGATLKALLKGSRGWKVLSEEFLIWTRGMNMYVYYMCVCMYIYICLCCHLYFHCSRSRLYIMFISVEQVPDNIQKTYRPAKVWYVYIK